MTGPQRAAGGARKHGSWRDLAWVAAVAVVYFVPAKFGLSPAFAAKQPVTESLREHARYFAEISGLTIRVLEHAPLPELERRSRCFCSGPLRSR